MSAETHEPDEGLPWMSWLVTGIVTMAGVLVFGIVVSAQHPRAAASAGRPVVANAPTMKDSGTQIKPDSSASAAVSSGAAADSAAPPVVTKPAATSAPPVAVNPKPVSTAAPSAAPQPTAPAPSSDAAKPQAEKVDPQPTASVDPRPQPEVTKPAAPVAIDPAKQAEYVKAVADVRRAMAARDLKKSKQHLQTALGNAQSTAEHTEADRLQMLQENNEQFWDGIRKAVAAMQPVDEIVLSDSDRVAVIEASRTELAVQMYGRPQRYRIEAIPMNLLSAIAKANFKQTPDAKLIVGSFLAMDAHGDRAEARKLWREAAAAGQEEGKQLLPELDVPLAGTRGAER